ncbi:MAG: hypothetical protein WC422_05285 [Candidatus Paceibacterota bacterium]|jgi:hypothetical protein
MSDVNQIISKPKNKISFIGLLLGVLLVVWSISTLIQLGIVMISSKISGFFSFIVIIPSLSKLILGVIFVITFFVKRKLNIKENKNNIIGLLLGTPLIIWSSSAISALMQGLITEDSLNFSYLLFALPNLFILPIGIILIMPFLTNLTEQKNSETMIKNNKKWWQSNYGKMALFLFIVGAILNINYIGSSYNGLIELITKISFFSSMVLGFIWIINDNKILKDLLRIAGVIYLYFAIYIGKSDSTSLAGMFNQIYLLYINLSISTFCLFWSFLVRKMGRSFLSKIFFIFNILIVVAVYCYLVYFYFYSGHFHLYI